MRVVLITGNNTVMPLISFLAQNGLLVGVALQDVLYNSHTALVQVLQENNVQNIEVNKEGFNTTFYHWVKKTNADVAIIFGFSFIIPPKFFDATTYGFFNIHFSLLPAYKGPNPLFWQLKNNELETGISIHKITKNVDAGPVFVQQKIPIAITDNYSSINIKLAQLTISSLQLFLVHHLFLPTTKPFAPITKASYFKRPTPIDQQINWQIMPSTIIAKLVNACNPIYNGAITYFRGEMLRILDAEAIKNFLPEQTATKPGAIIIEERQRLLVCCNKATMIEIFAVQCSLGNLGAKNWMQFFNPQTNESFQ